ncbi:hypothetical protein BC628DRAFT_1383602 [Trametes gibbosa]|nr:hypothetical protein BC628DRAFT_1383602 [Trametes gibbosa]
MLARIASNGDDGGWSTDGSSSQRRSFGYVDGNLSLSKSTLTQLTACVDPRARDLARTNRIRRMCNCLDKQYCPQVRAYRPNCPDYQLMTHFDRRAGREAKACNAFSGHDRGAEAQFDVDVGAAPRRTVVLHMRLTKTIFTIATAVLYSTTQIVVDYVHRSLPHGRTIHYHTHLRHLRGRQLVPRGVEHGGLVQGHLQEDGEKWGKEGCCWETVTIAPQMGHVLSSCRLSSFS